MLMGAMAVLAVIVFIALFFFKAGYGYLGGGNWGPKISNRAGWVIMECPAFLFMLMYTVRHAMSGTDTGNSSTALYIMAALFLVHYFQRSFIFPLLMRGKGSMPIVIIAMGFIFNTMNSYFIGEWLFRFAPAGKYTIEWLASPQFIIGTLLFLAGMLINLDSDHVIRNLRKPGDTRHYIPRKGLYKICDFRELFRRTHGMGRICDTHLVSCRTAFRLLDIREPCSEGKGAHRQIRRGIRRRIQEPAQETSDTFYMVI